MSATAIAEPARDPVPAGGGAPPTRVFGATIAVGAALIALPWAIGAFGDAWIRALCFVTLYVMLALGLNIVVGFAGLLDLGYIAFYAVGAYTYALLASPHLTEHFPALAHAFPGGLHVSIWVALPIGASLAAAFGILLGTPVLKLRGDYLAIVTLGFGEIIRIFLNNLNAPLNFTNGPSGITLIDPVRIGNFNLAHPGTVLGTRPPSLVLYYYLLVAVALLAILVCVRLQDSRLGRAWMALREDEVAARAMGVNVRNVKLLAFSLGATFGGVAGGLFAAFQGFVSPESFSLNESIVVLSMIVLGGLGHVPGVVLGAVMLAMLPEALRHTAVPLQLAVFGRVLIDAEVLRMLLYGLATVGVMLYRPRGLWPAPEHGMRRPFGRVATGGADSAKAVSGHG
jgi:branched-chain amino acid transport system permease protein